MGIVMNGVWRVASPAVSWVSHVAASQASNSKLDVLHLRCNVLLQWSHMVDVVTIMLMIS